MVAAALFQLKDDDLARSVVRASHLIRMLTTGDGQLQNIPSLESPPISSKAPSPRGRPGANRKLTWSESSPLAGFDLRLRAYEMQDISTFSNLIIKITLDSEEKPQKVHLLCLTSSDHDRLVGLK
jgi:hypothetical protein